MKKDFKKILDLLSKNLNKIKEKEAKNLVFEIKNPGRIFIVGAGRSGLAGRAFGMRLMHLGFEVFIVGDTITPSIKKEDSLIAISGSGETSFVVSCARAAKKNKSKLISICGNKKSSIGILSDVFVEISTSIDRKKIEEKDYTTRQLLGEETKKYMPLGTLFELSVIIFLEGVVARLIEESKTREDEMKKRHANLE